MNSFSLIQTGIAEPKLAKPLGRERVVGLEQPFELQERLVVERDGVQILVLQAGLVEDVARRIVGKRGIVSLPREALLLRGRDDFAVDEQRRRAVVVVRRYAENRLFHTSSRTTHRAPHWHARTACR